MEEYVVTVSPFVSESGTIWIPEGTKDIGEYINAHFSEIRLIEDYHDYSGAHLSVRNKAGEVIYEQD